jgi:hypothetical protein
MVARDAPDNESLRLELQQAILTVRQWSSLLIQMAGFITTADVVLISYGFAQKLAGVLLLASALPIILLRVLLRIISILSPLAGLVLRIERRLLIREDSLGATFAYASLQPSGITSGDIEKLDDDKVHELNLSISTWQWLRRPIPRILCVATATQLGLFVLALTVFHYRFM